MGEEYSELWVTVRCRYSPSQKQDITKSWNTLLAKYKTYEISDDKHEEMFQNDGIHFSIGANSRKSDYPNYEMQYQMFGEFILAIQNTLMEWNLECIINISFQRLCYKHDV